MNIRDAGYVRVVDIEGNTISQQDIKNIKNLFWEKDLKQRIGINLGQVNYIQDDFISLLKNISHKEKASVFNLNNDIYMLFFVLNADKYVDIYLDERDFCSQKNLLVYRRFKLLKSA